MTSAKRSIPTGEVGGRCKHRSCGAFEIVCASNGRGCAAHSSLICAGKKPPKYLQQQIVTDRQWTLRAGRARRTRSAIPGIVHGSSGTGASLFLEPLSTVEINNDIVALEQQESEEVHRILVALRDTFRGRGDDLSRTVAAATEFDVLQGRRKFSISVDGIEPKLSADGRLELRGARHPLLTGKPGRPSPSTSR